MAKANAASASPQERRKSERTDLVVRVDYHAVDQFFSEFASNINEGGIFIESDRPHPSGTLVDLEFRLPGSDDPLHLRGTVVHVEDGSGQVAGMGIEFDHLDGSSRQRINALVKSLRTDG